MTALIWDQIGERIFQTGIDRGVLYPSGEAAVVWNGLTNVEETPNGEVKPFYLNGVKYLEYLSPGDFSATLKAFTYPDEFDAVNGILKLESGFSVHDQPTRSFGLSYRTKIGDGLTGVDAAYLIHILYNILANPDAYSFSTLGAEIQPIEFSWNLTARPVIVSGGTWRPTAHVTVDSRDVTPDILTILEETLYGTVEAEASLPTIAELIALLTPLEE